MASLVVVALSLNCLWTTRLIDKLVAGYFNLPTFRSWTGNGDVGVSHTLEVPEALGWWEPEGDF